MSKHFCNLLILNELMVVLVIAAVNVPLTVQEAIYPGISGIARTNEPFCQGIPFADSQAISSTSVLGLTGATAGQFRILGKWPSGNAKWVEVCCIIPSLSAGGTTTVTLTSSGSGNFGGSNLATDNGTTITVATGAATFTVKKANFNVLDQVVVGTKTVVASGTSQGLVVTGPPASATYPGSVTCNGGSCTSAFSSANDPSSTCSIEKNGPVEAIVKCTGNHVDAGGDVYVHFTIREYFHQGKTWVKINSSLRNADYGTSNTFATAYKGLQAHELRISPNMTGMPTYSIGSNTTPVTGTIGGTDSVYLYQAKSTAMQTADWCTGFGCIDPTTDVGYQIVKNGTSITTGTSAQPVQGWADIGDSSGVGVGIGVYQMAAYYPKSLEFLSGGTDLRIGIWARENGQPQYLAWPQHNIHDLFLNFHATAPASPANEFLKFQQYLLARADTVSYYNATGVFPYALVDGSTVDAWMTQTGANAAPNTISTSRACCISDIQPAVYRYWYWQAPGPFRPVTSISFALGDCSIFVPLESS